MRLAGITWWRNNYGSILQAYALQTVIQQFDNIEYEILCQYGKKIASASNFLDKLKTIGLKDTVKRIFWKFGLPGLKRRNQNIQKFVDEKLHVSIQEYPEDIVQQANTDYDGFICGSDQIWNPKLTELSSMYWLGFAAPDKLKIAYAPSIGVDALTDIEKIQIKKNLSSFQAISCREESGTRLINEILEENRCTTVLDPTLLVDRSIWDSFSEKRWHQEPYIFAYMLRGNKEQRKFIESFAKKKKLKIITMPFLDTEKIELYDFEFGDIKFWDAGPEEFINAIRYAEYVFTDSFHSMVFSCLYHRPFFVFPKIGPAQLNRLVGLQRLLKIDSRMIETFSLESLESMKPINWTRVDQILLKEREKSNKYLHDALQFRR